MKLHFSSLTNIPYLQAVERLVEPPEVKHERLLVVSVLGFVVNLVSIL